MFVVADSRERRAKERRTRHIPTRLTVHMAFVPLAGSEKWLMRVDEQHSVTRSAFRRPDGPHIRALRIGHFSGVFLGDARLPV